MRKVIMSMLLLLFAATFVTAQPARGQRGGDRQLMSQLDLSPEQEAQLKAIRQQARTQVEDLRKAAPNERPDRAEVAKIRETAKKATKAILTPTQQQQLATLRAERKAAFESVDRKALKADLRAHHEAEVKPVVKAARAQLDQFISADDQTAITRLRGVMKTRPKAKRATARGAERQAPTEEQRAAARAAMETWKTDHADELAELKSLADKYATDINRIQQNLQPQMDKWKSEKREIMNSHLPEDLQQEDTRKVRRGKKGGKDHAKRGKKGDWPKGTAFLLMKG